MATQWYQTVYLPTALVGSVAKRFRLGTEKKSMDGSVWVFGKGVPSNTVGSWVVFNDNTFTPVLMNAATPSTGVVAISAAANVLAANFSWYLIKGASTNTALKGLVVIVTGSTDKGTIYQSATPGSSTTTAAATKAVYGAWAIGVSAANLGDALLNYPSTLGQSTL
jgi:hypothetical protein